ncbi:hypothetical protein KEM48_007600 [Puccinia striiformis f. sp. tritici PST-130]|nr:hypothetical protein KEM48_007600 [Puccinia striiformis f. sp. tritici PST-130]
MGNDQSGKSARPAIHDNDHLPHVTITSHAWSLSAAFHVTLSFACSSPGFSGLSRGYHGASIHQHRTTEFLKKLVEAKETKGLSFCEIAKGIKSGTAVQMPPSDPLMYRLYEFLIVYGFPLQFVKAISISSELEADSAL